MLILLQQVTEGQLIKPEARNKEKSGSFPLVEAGRYAARQDGAVRIRRRRPCFCYFAFSVAVRISTFNTCKRICVPLSSFTLSVFDTITGPGVLALGTVLRLKPLSPRTPNGIPMLMGAPPDAVSGWVDEP